MSNNTVDDSDFDIEAAMQGPQTEAEAEGRRPLPEPGIYANCVITDVTAQEPFEKEAEDGVEVVYRVKLQCEKPQAELEPRIKFRGSWSRGSNVFKLWDAAVGDDKLNKTWRDLIGERVDVVVDHGMFNGHTYADYKFAKVRQ